MYILIHHIALAGQLLNAHFCLHLSNSKLSFCSPAGPQVG